MRSGIILSALCRASQLKGLSLPDILNEHYEYLLTVFHNFSNLQEIELDNYSPLPALNNLSNLIYLKISNILGRGSNKQEFKQYPYLLQLLLENRNALKYLNLNRLKVILTDIHRFLNRIALCTNLVELYLSYTNQIPEDISLYGVTQ